MGDDVVHLVLDERDLEAGFCSAGSMNLERDIPAAAHSYAHGASRKLRRSRLVAGSPRELCSSPVNSARAWSVT